MRSAATASERRNNRYTSEINKSRPPPSRTGTATLWPFGATAASPTDPDGFAYPTGSYGLSREGTNVPERTAGDVAHRDVPTCTLTDSLVEVRERVRAAGWDTCTVINEERVVLGGLGRKALASDSDETSRPR